MQTFDDIDVFTNGQIHKHQHIEIQNGKIQYIADAINKDSDTDLLLPGFIDLQIYGAAGKLFSAEPSLESIRIIEDQLLREGTTSFLICLATNTPEVFNECISVIKEYEKDSRNCMGLHLEGPFINPEKRGAHVKEYIRKASLDEIKQLLDFGDGTIKMMTLAPELQDDAVIQYLLDHEVVLSLGHSNANFKQATIAYNQGIQTTTHLFNAMSPIQHRAPGIPTAVFSHPTAMASIIADGLHVDFEVVKIAAKMMKGQGFSLEDFRDQLVQMRSMGGMMSMLDKLPGMKNLPAGAMDQMGNKQFNKMEAIINSMTKKERLFPDLIKGSRKKRIAAGSGTQVQDVNQMLKQFTQMQKMMKQMSGKGGLMKMMRGMGGKLPPGLLPPR